MQHYRIVSVFTFNIILLAIGAYFSLKIGAFSYQFSEVWYHLTTDDSSNEAIIMQEVRLPRLLMTLLVGGNMAVAGAMIQALTRNPLASPSVLGINAGASFFVVAAIVFFPSLTGIALAGMGFAGGIVASSIIFLMTAVLQGGKMLIKIALIGVVIQSLFASATQTLLIFNEESINQILIWLTGTLAGSVWNNVYILATVSIFGFLLSLSHSRSLFVMSLGDETARSLGQRVQFQKFITITLAVLLAGCSVAFTGPIGFIGLIIPHIVRYLVGNSYYFILPVSALAGANLLLAADILSRFVSYPAETPVGIVTAFIGAPYFIYLARTMAR